MILDSKLAEIKGADAPVERTMIEGEGISQKELVAAIINGTYSAKHPQWQEQLRLLKEWSAFWGPGYLSLDPDGAYRLFVTGQAAMLYDNSGQIKVLESDPLRRFEFGIFDFPRITRKVHLMRPASPLRPSADTPARDTTPSPPRPSRKASPISVIDWLMFITAPQNYIPLANDWAGIHRALSTWRESTPGSSLLCARWKTECFVSRLSSGAHRGVRRPVLPSPAGVFRGPQIMDDATNEIQRYMEQAAYELIERNGWTDLLSDLRSNLLHDLDVPHARGVPSPKACGSSPTE